MIVGVVDHETHTATCASSPVGRGWGLARLRPSSARRRWPQPPLAGFIAGREGLRGVPPRRHGRAVRPGRDRRRVGADRRLQPALLSPPSPARTRWRRRAPLRRCGRGGPRWARGAGGPARRPLLLFGLDPARGPGPRRPGGAARARSGLGRRAVALARVQQHRPAAVGVDLARRRSCSPPGGRSPGPGAPAEDDRGDRRRGHRGEGADGAADVTAAVQSGLLPIYVAVTLTTAAVVPTVGMPRASRWPGGLSWSTPPTCPSPGARGRGAGRHAGDPPLRGRRLPGRGGLRHDPLLHGPRRPRRGPHPVAVETLGRWSPSCLCCDGSPTGSNSGRRRSGLPCGSRCRPRWGSSWC